MTGGHGAWSLEVCAWRGVTVTTLGPEEGKEDKVCNLSRRGLSSDAATFSSDRKREAGWEGGGLEQLMKSKYRHWGAALLNLAQGGEEENVKRSLEEMVEKCKGPGVTVVKREDDGTHYAAFPGDLPLPAVEGHVVTYIPDGVLCEYLGKVWSDREGWEERRRREKVEERAERVKAKARGKEVRRNDGYRYCATN